MQDIHSIRPPVQVGFDPLILKIILVVTGAILVFAILFFLIKKWLKKRQEPREMKCLPEPLAPYEAALRELDLLSQRQVVHPRLFYFDLTAVLRQYVGRSFHINAIEMTSQEFIKQINQLDVDRSIKKAITEFFKLSDPIKYAGVVPEEARVKKAVSFIREQVNQIEKMLIDQRAEKEEDH